MPPFSTLAFDLDGTLTDSREGIISSLRYALRALRLRVDEAMLTPELIGAPVRQVLEYLGVPREKEEQALTAYRTYFANQGMWENAPYPGIAELLARLQDAGVTLLVATSKPTQFAEQILERFELARYFTRIQGSTLDDTLTDKTEILRVALATVPDLQQKTTAMIGDRKHDMLAARANGIDSIGVLYGYGARAELEEAGATRIAGSVEELGALLGA